MVSFLKNEASADRVRTAIEGGAAASWVNLGEALYIEARRVGWDRASEAVDGLASNLVAESADPDIVRAAASIKVEGGLSFADCFAVATAEHHRAELLTSDQEIIELKRPGLSVIDLRESP